MDALMLSACLAGHFGHIYGYDGGAVIEAGFIYLAGKADTAWLDALPEKWKYRMFICLSSEWEQALTGKYPDMIVTRRTVLRAEQADFDTQALLGFVSHVPRDIRVIEFDEAVFAKKPFGHGAHYASFDDFKTRGVGAAALCGEKPVCSCSSYLTEGNAVEVDISTLPEYRKKGIGLACAAKMILLCMEKGFVPHWDAQNEVSSHIAQKLGYRIEYTYTGYSFERPSAP